MRPDRKTTKRRTLRGIAAPVIVLHAAVAGVLPILHGHAESLSAHTTVEADHSNQCVPIHGEQVCTFSGHSSVAHVAVRELPPPTAIRRIRTSPDDGDGTARSPNPSSNGERAPPTA